MPKVRTIKAQPTSDGYRAAYSQPEPPPRESTPVELDRDRLYREIMDDPARGWVWDILQTAEDLGLDTGDPETVRRALAVARRRWDAATSRTAEPSAYSELSAARRAARKHPPVVYYMRTGDLVKIGTTIRIGPRLASVGAVAVMAIEPGDSLRETVRHQQFRHLRNHGEWFRLEEDLGLHIVDVRESFAATTSQTTEEWLAEWIPRRYAASRADRQSEAA